MNKILSIDSGTAKSGLSLLSDGRYEDSITLSYDDAVKKNETVGYFTCISERRVARAARRHYHYSRERRAQLLRVLMSLGMCPHIEKSALRLWTHKKIAPTQFIDEWMGVQSPYEARCILLSKKLDMNDSHNLYIFGRAMYSLVHQRGFDFADAVESDDDKKEKDLSETGLIKKSVTTLAKDMETAGCKYVSQYLWNVIQSGERVKARYHKSKKQMIEEFDEICRMQEIADKTKLKLKDIIFGPGKRKFPESKRKYCIFEKDSKVCFDSHPDFEEYRMWQFINHIKVGEEQRPLTQEEASSIVPLFYKYKGQFKFSHIRNMLKVNRANYNDDDLVTGCLFSRSIAALLFDDKSDYPTWREEAARRLSATLKHPVNPTEAGDIIWNECFIAKRNDRDSTRFFEHKLNIHNYSKDNIALTTDTTSLSKKACQKITHWMRDYGLTQHLAVRMVMIPKILAARSSWNTADEIRKERINTVIEKLKSYSYEKNGDMTDYLCDVLNHMALGNTPVTRKELNKTLWHHSQLVGKYAPVTKDGCRILPMPDKSMMSPAVWRTICILRKYINRLILDGRLDETDTVVIESERRETTLNERKATDVINKKNEKQREKIRKIYGEWAGHSNCIPTGKQILLYELWEEQNHIDIWTGRYIPENEIFSGNYDDDHTVPVSRGGLNTKDNKTITDKHFNQKVKKNILPGLMSNIDEVLERVDSIYGTKIRELEEEIRKNKNKTKTTKDPDKRNELIVKRLVMQNDLIYYKRKVWSFSVIQDIDSYSGGQGATNDYIVRELRNWLKCLFKDVRLSRNNIMISAREQWGVPKIREYNSNHAEDAFIHGVAAYYGTTENIPYPEFYDDIERLQKNNLTVHTPHSDYSKKMHSNRGRGYGKCIHEETQYGVIRDNASKELQPVLRKNISSINLSNVKNIIDPDIRERVMTALETDTIATDSQGKKIRHVRIKKEKKKVNAMFSCQNRNSHSRHEYKNRRYYNTNGQTYAMYGDNHRIQPVPLTDEIDGIVPEIDSKIGKHLYNLRVGDMVAVYTDDETPEVFDNMPREEFSKRLFCVKQIEIDRIRLYHHDFNIFNKKDKPKNDNYNDVSKGVVKHIRSPKIPPMIKVSEEMRKRFLK